MNKLFPIQGEEGRYGPTPPIKIPWSVAEIAYKEYASRHGTRQTLERLAERGGFGRDELLDLLKSAGEQHETRDSIETASDERAGSAQSGRSGVGK